MNLKMNSSFEVIDLRQYRNPKLLEKVYVDLYEKAFTDPSEVESLDQYATRLWSPQLPPPQPMTHFFVAGTELLDPSRRKVDGFLICESYRESLCGLITFVVIEEHSRGKGLAKKMIGHGREQLNIDMLNFTQELKGLQALFAEMHNPREFFGADIIDPNMRLQIMRKLGAHWVPIRYVQPELQPGAPRSHHLFMTAFPVSEAGGCVELYSEVVHSFLYEFYQALGVENPDIDTDYLSMVRNLYGKEVVPNLAPELPMAILKSGEIDK
jgi:hypothetical protein